MALLVNDFFGFETGGLEEAFSVSGAPSIQDVVVRTGNFSLKLPDDANESSYTVVPYISTITQGNKFLIGFAFQTSNVTPAVDIDFCQAMEQTTPVLRLRHEAVSGDLILVDVAGAEVDTIINPFTVDNWHYIEILWEHLDSGDCDVYIDGAASGLSVVATDFDDGGPHGRYDFYVPANSGADIYIDDVYVRSGASDVGDFLGPGAEVLGAYQNTVEDATDQGDTLDQGTWADAGHTPGVDEANPAAYENSGAQSGYTICDEGLRDGPDGDITGTAVGGKWLHRLQRDGGGGTNHYKRWGKNAALTDTPVSLTTSEQNFFTISEDGTFVPNVNTDYFSQGIRKDTGGQNNEVSDMWSFLLHVVAGAPPTGQPTPIRTQGTPTGSGYRDRIGGWN